MKNTVEPGYLKLHDSGLLQERVEKAHLKLQCCTVCPQHCRVDRTAGSLGICGVGSLAPVSSFGPHFGEEKPLVGNNGSGTIFFSSCNLLCIFCQNYDISHFCDDNTRYLSSEELAEIMISLQQRGCHNINFVTPSHVVPQILSALPPAIEMGLHIPLVYNSSGYDDLETLQLLDNVFDIYMPDFKFWSNSIAAQYTQTKNYADVARNAISAMFSQVGNLKLDKEGIARKGLLIRHLVMPNLLDETQQILQYISQSISPTCYVNIMDQYRPCYKASGKIDRMLTSDEYQDALHYASTTQLVQLNEGSVLELLKKLGILPE